LGELCHFRPDCAAFRVRQQVADLRQVADLGQPARYPRSPARAGNCFLTLTVFSDIIRIMSTVPPSPFAVGVPFAENPRRISKKRLDALRSSLADLGELGGVVHDLNSDQIISGNQHMRAIGKRGVRVEFIDEEHAPDAQGTVRVGFITWPGGSIPYRQVRWDADTCQRANIVANTDAGFWDWDALAGWDAAQLQEWGLDAEQLTAWNNDAANLGAMLTAEEQDDDGSETGAGDDAPVDRAEELQEKWRVEVGDLWRIGEHVIICGDCREQETWARLLGVAGVGKASLCVADPPYGVGRDKGFGGADGFGGSGKQIPRRQYKDSWDGKRPEKQTFDILLASAETAIIFGGNFFTDLIPVGGHWIVWDKENTMPTFGDCELAWTNVAGRHSVKKYTVVYNGLIGKEGERYAPTQKPVELLSRIILDYSDDGDAIADPFLGSGTTIVAAHKNNRRGLGIELLPKYCAVTLERMATAFPDLEIERVGAED